MTILGLTSVYFAFNTRTCNETAAIIIPCSQSNLIDIQELNNFTLAIISAGSF